MGFMWEGLIKMKWIAAIGLLIFFLVSISVLNRSNGINPGKVVQPVHSKVESHFDSGEHSFSQRKPVEHKADKILTVDEASEKIKVVLKIEEKDLPKKDDEKYRLQSKNRVIAGLWKNQLGQAPSYKQRINSVNQLGLNLEVDERQDLYQYLRYGPDNNAYDLHIKDRLMIKFESQQSGQEEYVNELKEMVFEEELDGEFRGYVMQHLRSEYFLHERSRSELKKIIIKGMKDVSSDVSGTALLAVADMNTELDNIEKIEVQKGLLDIVNSKDSHQPSRVTAFSLAGKLEVEDALPAIRKEIKEGKDYTAKIAALYSLGNLGDETDEPLLEEVLNSHTNAFIIKAAKQALEKLKI